MAAALLAAGCGGSDDSGQLPADRATTDRGVLRWALPRLTESLDPLAAATREARLITRQVHEPLVFTVRAPFGTGRTGPGLALAARPGVGETVWTLTLRRRVLFGDGTPFNAAAVLANARRWLADPSGRRLLGDVTAVDAPRSHEVRFVTASPSPDFPRRLASPRLGIVSPDALDPSSGVDATFIESSEGTGTGPFDPAGSSDTSLELGRNPDWWGVRRGFGPGIHGIVLIRAERKAGRLALLEVGQAEVATLGPPLLRQVAEDPLLTRIGAGAAAERSVRGLHPDEDAPQLSGVWLTTLAG